MTWLADVIHWYAVHVARLFGVEYYANKLYAAFPYYTLVLTLLLVHILIRLVTPRLSRNTGKRVPFTDAERDKIVLHQFGSFFCLPCVSPFSIKLHAYFRMLGVDYITKKSFNLNYAPKHKKPFISYTGEAVSVSCDYGSSDRFMVVDWRFDIDYTMVQGEVRQASGRQAERRGAIAEHPCMHDVAGSVLLLRRVYLMADG